MMAEKGYQSTGVDIAPTAIDWAREKARSRGVQADFFVGNVCELAACSSSAFDMVLDGHCLHCIVGEDRKPVLAQTRRVLKPGGYMLVLTMCGAPDECDWPKLNYDPETCCQVVDGVALRYFTSQEELLAELQGAGFAVVAHRVLAKSDLESHSRLWVDATLVSTIG
jgi:ubiquinone/menaquinone biosynthesis C-methylase UbiE